MRVFTVYNEFYEMITFGKHVELSLYHISARNPDATLLLRHNHKFWTDGNVSRKFSFDFKDSQRSADKLKFPERIRTREHVVDMCRVLISVSTSPDRTYRRRWNPAREQNICHGQRQALVHLNSLKCRINTDPFKFKRTSKIQLSASEARQVI
jgi:hypothetical protein